MRSRLLFAILLGAVCAGAQQPQPARAPQASVPVVVELFTSEGCSNCPPADDLLARLDSLAEPRMRRRGSSRGAWTLPGIEIIALGEHVDYWDHAGWKDSFSSPLFSTRQQDYGIAFGSATVFTPQAVIQGTKEVSVPTSGL